MLKINEAIKEAQRNGLKIQKQDIAAKIWKDSSPATQRVNMTNLCSGNTERVLPEWLNIICEMTGVSADFLLGRTNN